MCTETAQKFSAPTAQKVKYRVHGLTRISTKKKKVHGLPRINTKVFLLSLLYFVKIREN